MSEDQACPSCGRQIPSYSPGGLCPQCLLKAGVGSSDPRLDPTQASPRDSFSGFVPPSPEQLADRFPQLEILELLGKGGMGAVYKARQRGLDRLVALKILPPEVSRDPTFFDRFQREARALAKLNHPNIVAVYDYGQAEELCYFLMEFIDGVNLRQALQAGKMAARDALAVVPQICDALQFAHDEGIVHRDIKPENILIDKRGRVKIADFGLAKLLGAQQNEQRLTGTMQVMGTLRYMAPEQMEGSREVDHRADIFSLGVVFYELLTGELPIGRFAPPSKKAQLDVRLDEVVLRALEKEPDQRYQQASEVKTQVETICGLHPRLVAQIYGREWRSQAEFFGLPLVHVAYGIDPHTGRKRVAKGIIALGDIAIGVVALGGVAMGGLCFGGVSLGLMSFAGLAIGLWLAVGGCAIGLYALGGFALGAVAIGGSAVGYFAVGGGGVAAHGFFGHHQDPLAREFFTHPSAVWPHWLTLLTALVPPVYTLLWGVGYALCLQSPATINPSASVPPQKQPAARTSPSRPWLVPVLATFNLFAALLLLLVTTAEDTVTFPVDTPKFWLVWGLVDNVLGYLMAAAIFLASIGLFLWQPWARRVIVGVCIFGLVTIVIDMPYLTRFVIPSAYADLKASLASEFSNPGDLEGVAGFLTLTLIGGAILSYLLWLLVTLIYFTLPNVVAAFEPEFAPSSPEVGGVSEGSLLASSWLRKGASTCCTLVYLACLIMFFSFTGKTETKADQRLAQFEVGRPSPWLVMNASRGTGAQQDLHDNRSFHLFSTSVLVGIVGILCIGAIRQLEYWETGRAHSLAWHYAIWGVLLLGVIAFGIIHQMSIHRG